MPPANKLVVAPAHAARTDGEPHQQRPASAAAALATADTGADGHVSLPHGALKSLARPNAAGSCGRSNSCSVALSRHAHIDVIDGLKTPSLVQKALGGPLSRGQPTKLAPSSSANKLLTQAPRAF